MLNATRIGALLLLACGGPTPSDPPEPGSITVLESVACAEPGLRDTEGFYQTTTTTAPATRVETQGAVLAGDFDGDGWTDLIEAHMAGPRLVWNEAGVLQPPVPLEPVYDMVNGGTVIDFDDDGDFDLYLTRWNAPDVLLANDGSGVFSDATASAGLVADDRASITSSWADIDGDGDLDLWSGTYALPVPSDDPTIITTPSVLHEYVAGGRIWLNDGSGHFSMAEGRLPSEANSSFVFGGGFHDIDDDGDPDLIVVTDFGGVIEPTRLYLNDGSGVFSMAPDFVATGPGMGLAVGDLNGDRFLDVAVTFVGNFTYLESVVTEEGPIWVDFTAVKFDTPSLRPRFYGWGTEFVDLDNDADLDLLMHYGFMPLRPANPVDQPDQVYLNDRGMFSEAGEAFGLDHPGVMRGSAVVDLNHDGYPDVVALDLTGQVVQNLSRCGDAGWLTIELAQEPPNRHAVGARITVEAGGTSQFRDVLAGGTNLGFGGPPQVHFGLGGHGIDRVRVRWPDGSEDVYTEPKARQRLQIRRSVRFLP